MNLIEKIDELRAQSVSAEQFKNVWGITIEEYLDKMMHFVESEKLKMKSEK